MPTNDSPTLAPLLSNLEARSVFTRDEAEALLALPFRPGTIESGSYLICEGDPMGHCCVILDGCAFRYKTVKDGSRQILGIHFRGDLLGLGLGLLDWCDHGIQAARQSYVAYIPHRVILETVVEFPNIGRALWRETLVEASIAREWIVNVGQRDARKRIAHLFCEVAARQIETMRDHVTIDWPLTQEQIGDATGLTGVHVNRTMQALRASGLIGAEKRALTILDWAGLQEAGEFHRGYLHLDVATAGDGHFHQADSLRAVAG